MASQELLRKWRLILGPQIDSEMQSMGGAGMSDEDLAMDEALGAIYDDTSGDFAYGKGGGKGAGNGPSSPVVAKWLGDIRTFFKDDMVSVIQSDAIERKGLKQLLFEPETLKSVKPDINMVTTIMSLRGKIPERTKETARLLIKEVVDELNKQLENDIRRAVTGALNRRSHSPIPNAASIDWKMTLRRNVKNYNPSLNRIVPERFFFFDRAQKANKYTIIVDIDTSGSMGDSIVYGSLAGCIFSSISSLKTHVIAFDTEVVDLTDKYGSDPVDMIFGIQLGGGTDINKSVAYCEQFITEPKSTIFIVITDLYEGGNESQLMKRMEAMAESGVKVIGLMALSDAGNPSYDERAAGKLAKMGIPCFACTPKLLPQLMEGVLKGYDLMEVSKRIKEQMKKK